MKTDRKLQKTPIIWIISGPSSVGKSDFIKNQRCAQITNFPPNTPVIMGYSFDSNKYDGTPIYFHYNILRPLDIKLKKKRKEKSIKYFGVHREFNFDEDEKWKDLLRSPSTKKAIVLISSKETILKRLDKRRIVESKKLSKRKETHYPHKKWRNYYKQLNLIALYQQWFNELKVRGIPYKIIDASDRNYSIIKHNEQLYDLLGEGSKKYTKNQIIKILKDQKFEYHRVNLPYGLHTPGDDRSLTRDLIFTESIEGKTVLDIGCALGYMCFEAEALGASRIVGVEIKDNRFLSANLLKKIKSSNVEFIKRDIISNPIEEHFDYILLLNVIHHLKEPIKILRQLALLADEKLIIEFPTLDDNKFRKTIGNIPSSFNNLPLIGVSSIFKADQTFLFTSEAIKRILLDHECLFEDVTIFPSPVKARAIAVCSKHKDKKISRYKKIIEKIDTWVKS